MVSLLQKWKRKLFGTPKRKGPFTWLKSTLGVLVIVFISSSGYAIYTYGLQQVIDESIFYLVGASFTAVILFMVGKALANKQVNT